MRDSLCAIACDYAHATDKTTKHTYVRLYEELMAPYRDGPRVIVEVGVGDGGSLAMWCAYFDHPGTRVFGVDLRDRGPIVARVVVDPRLTVVTGDASRPATAVGIPPIDVFIDDGSHTLADQLGALEVWWDRVKPGGVYVIEDVHGDERVERLLGARDFVVYDRRGIRRVDDDIVLVAHKR